MTNKLIWLSHLLDHSTVIYGGGQGIMIERIRDINQGDHCHESRITIQSHTGSHVDVPYHFLNEGKRVEDYGPEDWMFYHVKLFEVHVGCSELITNQHVLIDQVDPEVDLVLLRSGFEKRRHESSYWKENPGISLKLATDLIEYYPHLRGIGMDFISLTSYQHRGQGKMVHRCFLEKDIRIFEDLSLKGITHRIIQVIALPLRIKNSDGSSCTIIALEKCI